MVKNKGSRLISFLVARITDGNRLVSTSDDDTVLSPIFYLCQSYSSLPSWRAGIRSPGLLYLAIGY